MTTMSEGGRSHPPLLDQRTRRGGRSGIPRTIVRRDIFNQTVEADAPPSFARRTSQPP